jgi:hypothetical protein
MHQPLIATMYNVLNDFTSVCCPAGLGPSNPVKKDNLEEKRMKHLMTGLEDDKLVSLNGQHFFLTE